MNLISRLSLLLIVPFLAHGAVAQPTWKHVYGGFDIDKASSLIGTSDGAFLVAGSTGSFGIGSSDVYLFKVDQNGTRLWSAVYGGPEIDEARSVVELTDGGYLLAGTTNGGEYGGYDGLIIRTNENGDLIWQRSYGGSNWDFINAVDIDQNGGIWAAGTTYSFGASGDQWLLHLDINGDTLLTRHFGGSTNAEAFSVTSTTDGGCILAGSLVSLNGDKDAYVVKLNEDAEVMWQYTYGGDSLDLARDIITTIDGGYSFVGTTRSYYDRPEFYHVKLNVNGIQEWFWNYGQTVDREAFAHLQLSSGEYASIGYVGGGGAGGKDVELLKSDVDGYFIFGQSQGGEQDDMGYGVARANEGYVLCGTTLSYGAGLEDILVIRTNEVGFTDLNTVIDIFDPLKVEDVQNKLIGLHPNPSSGTISFPPLIENVVINVYDDVGRSVFKDKVPIGTMQLDLELKTGMYLVEFQSKKGDLSRAPILIINE